MLHLYRPQTKLREGNVFTGVCDSVHMGGVWSRGGACFRGVPAPGGACSWEVPTPGGGSVPGGYLLQGGAWWRPPPGRLLLQAVRILLECILVSSINTSLELSNGTKCLQTKRCCSSRFFKNCSLFFYFFDF